MKNSKFKIQINRGEVTPHWEDLNNGNVNSESDGQNMLSDLAKKIECDEEDLRVVEYDHADGVSF